MLLFWGAIPSLLAAQTIPSPYRHIETGQQAGIFAGWMSFDRGRYDLGPGSGIIVGGKYALESTGPLGLEGLLSFFPSTRYVINPRRLEGDRNIGEADALIGTAEACIRLNLMGRRGWNGISPFLYGGGGLAFDFTGARASDETLFAEDRFTFGNSFLGLLGSGVRWIPTRNVQLRADVSLRFWSIDTPEGFQSPEVGFENVPRGEWVKGLAVTVGLAIRF